MADEPNPPSSGTGSDVASTYLDRVTAAGKWVVGLIGAAGSFAAGKFAFDELGRRPTPTPPSSDQLDASYLWHWPGGDAWMALAVILFGIGVIVVASSVVAVIRSSRVSTAYLLKADAKGVQQQVRAAILTSSQLYQLPAPDLRDEVSSMADEWAAALGVGDAQLETAIPDAADDAAKCWRDWILAQPVTEPSRLAEVAGTLQSGRDANADVAALERSDGGARGEFLALLTKEKIADFLRRVTIDCRFVRPVDDARALFGLVLPIKQARELAGVLEDDARRLRRIVHQRSLVVAPVIARKPDDVEDRLTAALRRRLPNELGAAVELAELRRSVADAFEPGQITLDEFQRVYAAAIRSGDASRIRDLKARHAILLDTAANERTQAVSASSSKKLLWATPLVAVSAALFVFTVKSSHQMREDQETAATELREDALRLVTELREDQLRRLAEASEGDLIASAPTVAFLRVPTTVADDDPWSAFAIECGRVDTGENQPAASLAVPAVVVAIGAPPDTATVVAHDGNGAKDPDAVVRVITQQTTECRDSFEGWVPAAWVSTVAPDDGGGGGGGTQGAAGDATTTDGTAAGDVTTTDGTATADETATTDGSAAAEETATTGG